MKKLTVTLVAVLGLAACGDAALTDPNTFSSSLKDGVITGSYNPEGPSTQFVKNAIAFSCPDAELADYQEAPLDNGLIGFTAICA